MTVVRNKFRTAEQVQMKLDLTYEDIAQAAGVALVPLQLADNASNFAVMVEQVFVLKTQDFVHSGGKGLWVCALTQTGRPFDLLMPHRLDDGDDIHAYGLGEHALTPVAPGCAMMPLRAQGAIKKPIDNVTLGKLTYATWAGSARGIFVREDCLLTDLSVSLDTDTALSGAGELIIEAVYVPMAAGGSNVPDYAAAVLVESPGNWSKDAPLAALGAPRAQITAAQLHDRRSCAGFVPAGSWLTLRATHQSGTLTPTGADLTFDVQLHPLRGVGMGLIHGPVPVGNVGGEPYTVAIPPAVGGGEPVRGASLLFMVEDGASGAQLDDLTAGALSAYVTYRKIQW